MYRWLAKKHRNRGKEARKQSFFEGRRNSTAEQVPVVRQTWAIDRLKQQKLKFSRAVADRSPKSSRTIAGVKNHKKTPRGERSPNWGDRPPGWAVVLLIWANVIPANFQHRFFMSRTFAKLRRTTAKPRWYKNDDVLTSFQEGKLGQITWAINISCFGWKISNLREKERRFCKSLKNAKNTKNASQPPPWRVSSTPLLFFLHHELYDCCYCFSFHYVLEFLC